MKPSRANDISLALGLSRFSHGSECRGEVSMRVIFRIAFVLLLSYTAWQAFRNFYDNKLMIDDMRDQAAQALVQPKIRLQNNLVQQIQSIDANFSDNELKLKFLGDEYVSIHFTYYRAIDYKLVQLPMPFTVDMQVTRPQRSKQMNQIINSFESAGKAVDQRMQRQLNEP